MKAAEGWPIEAIVEVATPPVRVDLAPCSAAPGYQECLLGAGEALVAVHVSRNHGHGFTDLHKGRHKGTLDCEIVRYQGTIGIRRMVQQDEDASDVIPLLKALDLLLVPADLLAAIVLLAADSRSNRENEP